MLVIWSLIRRAICCLALSLFCASMVNAEVNAEIAEQQKADPRLSFLGKLIESSHGAKKVDASGNAEALALREEARALYLQAKNPENSEQVSGLLDQAAKKMFLAIKLTKTSETTSDKKNRDYKGKLKSVNALIEAVQRVSKTKGHEEESQRLQEQVQILLNQGDELNNKGEQDNAMALLNQAYLLVKSSLESLRRGDTLVRSLNFESKEEEYHYELDRNETHLMLVKVLSKGKQKKPAMEKMVQKFLDQARAIRKEAEQAAEKGDYEEAIKLMEKSTTQIVRAIRSAGVYIPG